VPSSARHAWKRFRRDGDAYDELLKELAERQQGLCIYCEQRLTDDVGDIMGECYAIEHVIPKSEGQALDWTNLALSCSGHGTGKEDLSCGAAKSNKRLPQGCDPRDFPVLPSVLTVGMDGRIEPDAPGCASAHIDEALLRETVDQVLNLNCERLRKSRQDAWRQVTKHITDLLNCLSVGNVADALLIGQMSEFVESRLRPDDNGCLNAFWTTERFAIGTAAETWIAMNEQVLR